MGKKKSSSDADAIAEPTRKSPRFQTVAKPQPKRTKEPPASKKVNVPKVQGKKPAPPAEPEPEEEPEEEPQEETVEAPTENGDANSKEPVAPADEAQDDAEEKEEEAEEVEKEEEEAE